MFAEFVNRGLHPPPLLPNFIHIACLPGSGAACHCPPSVLYIIFLFLGSLFGFLFGAVSGLVVFVFGEGF